MKNAVLLAETRIETLLLENASLFRMFFAAPVSGKTVDGDSLEELVEGFVNNDQDKTERLVRHYYKNIFFNCIRIVRDDVAAEDLTHETFIKALKYRASFDKTQKFIFWLLKISTNVCLDYFNYHKRENMNVVRIEALNATAGNFRDLNELLVDANAQINLDKKIEQEIVSNAVMLLPVMYRVPVLLRYYNDLSYEEIAAIMQKPVGTIKFRVNRAKMILAKALGIDDMI